MFSSLFFSSDLSSVHCLITFFCFQFYVSHFDSSLDRVFGSSFFGGGVSILQSFICLYCLFFPSFLTPFYLFLILLVVLFHLFILNLFFIFPYFVFVFLWFSFIGDYFTFNNIFYFHCLFCCCTCFSPFSVYLFRHLFPRISGCFQLSPFSSIGLIFLYFIFSCSVLSSYCLIIYSFIYFSLALLVYSMFTFYSVLIFGPFQSYFSFLSLHFYFQTLFVSLRFSTLLY